MIRNIMLYINDLTGTPSSLHDLVNKAGSEILQNYSGQGLRSLSYSFFLSLKHKDVLHAKNTEATIFTTPGFSTKSELNGGF